MICGYSNVTLSCIVILCTIILVLLLFAPFFWQINKMPRNMDAKAEKEILASMLKKK